jgi:hypothetical protein
MKQLLTLILLCLTLCACKKKYLDPSAFVYCKFTYYDRNDTTVRAYFLRDGKLYNHSSNSTTAIMTDEQYRKAEKVMNEIPSVIGKDPDIVYSCGCNSFDMVVLEYQQALDGRRCVFPIDLGAKNPPRKVSKFAEKVRKMMLELEQ